jgi:tRNA (adenine57-N1/adenine58-N1)-methyltransferase
LDIHVSPPTEIAAEEPPLEILEAGTGHGSLTLHLARAINAANSARPTLPRPVARRKKKEPESQDPIATPLEEAQDADATAEIERAYEGWKKTRKAIIHTLDNSKLHSDHARKVVRGFRDGLYFGNVDFHVGELHDFFTQRQQQSTNNLSYTEAPSTENKADSATQPVSDMPALPANPSPTPEPISFLTHCILDLPGAHDKMELVSKHMHTNGKLIIFVPSVTQIADCVDTVKRLRLPLLMDTVLELGGGISGGREWDVRTVRIRAKERKKAEAILKEGSAMSDTESSVDSTAEPTGDESMPETLGAGATAETEKEWALICRPKVGERVIGGGFLGVWSRMRDSKEE